MILRFVPRIPSDTKSTAAHWYRCSLHSGNWCETMASIVCNAFSAYRKSVQNTSGTRMVRNLAVWGGSSIDARMGRRVIESGYYIRNVDQLPAFNKLAQPIQSKPCMRVHHFPYPIFEFIKAYGSCSYRTTGYQDMSPGKLKAARVQLLACT